MRAAKKGFVSLYALVALLSIPPRAVFAVPPLVVGDAPTADKSHIEWYIGTRYQKTGDIEREIPSTELVYGITNRQEFTFEIPYMSLQGVQGFGDAVLGTKYQIFLEKNKSPGIAASFELKLSNASQRKGLGTGALDYDLRLRTQKTVGVFTTIGNLGYTIVGEPEVNGVRQNRRNVMFAAFAPMVRMFPKTVLLSEIYWENSDEPGEPNRFAGDIGLTQRLSSHLDVHGALGKSLRSGNRGGPSYRLYTGIKLEFSAPRLQKHTLVRGG